MPFSRVFARCLFATLIVIPSLRVDASTLRLPREFAIQRTHHAMSARVRDHASAGDIGSPNETTADPLVSRPRIAPCVAPLFTNATFAAYAGQTFAYTPPAACPGPFAKIVFNGNFSVSAGVQFDRTASVTVGNVPLYFGTTAEPGATLAPSWHVERDVTDDAALLASPQTTEADIFNIVNSTYTGVITGTAFLQFYPAQGRDVADTPDVVLPVPGVAGGPQHVNTGTDTLSATYTLPTNVERAELEIYMQSQQTDEQYFLCAPSDVAPQLFACGNGPLRETEVAIDGKPAGVAPVFPWIFTGGLDPYLWSPIPGVQTLEFTPYRVNITPFAALLSNGKPHTIALSVDNADNYFQGFATLFAYRDRAKAKLTGALAQDTLVADPPATVVESLTGTSPSIDGTIALSSSRAYRLAGYVDTSHGRVLTMVDARLDFANMQTYSNDSDFTETLVTAQRTTDDTTETRVSGAGIESTRKFFSYPLYVKLALVLDDTGTGTQVSSIDQRWEEAVVHAGVGGFYARYASNDIAPTDTLDILDDASITGNSNQKSTQTYDVFDTAGTCYSQSVAAANNLVSAVSNAPCNRNNAIRTLRALSGR